MRVEGGARAPGPQPPGARFGETLARAARAAEEGRGRDRTEAPRAQRAAAGRAGPRSPAVAPAEDAAAGLEPARAAPVPPEPRAGERSAELAPVEALARLARVLPPAIAALGPPGGAALALSFGRSLDVELRATAGGVDLVLRPEARLARAAEAELPRLVTALRARGVAVGRVEIRPRGQPGDRAR